MYPTNDHTITPSAYIQGKPKVGDKVESRCEDGRRHCDATGLIHTKTGTFANIEIFGMHKSTQGIEDEAIYLEYAQRENISGAGQYTLTGIDAPFTCTTTYTYDPATIDTGYPLFESFIDVVESSDRLTSFTNTGTQLIAVHTYNNSTDYTENFWKDRIFITSLHAGGVTRTVSYAMVSSDA